jgi:hypothetical protein
MAIQTYARSRSPSEMAVKAEALLSRYPNLSEEELEDLIDMFPALGILDVGLITADDRLSGQLEAFYRDHGKKLKIPVSSWVAFLAIPAILALGVLWWGLAPTAGM